MDDSTIQSGVDAYLAGEAQQKATTLRNNFVNAAGTTPDDFAKQMELSKATGIPVQSLFADPDEAKRHRAVVGTDFSGLVFDSPKTAGFLESPIYAGVSRDDTASLSTMERLLQGANYFGGSTVAGVHDLAGASAKLLSAVLPTTSDQDLATLYKNDPEGLKNIRENSLATILERFARKQTERSARTMDQIDPEAKARYGGLEYATTDLGNAAYLSPVKLLSDAVRSLPTTAALALTTIFTRGAMARAETQALRAGMTAAEARAAATAAAVEVASKFGAGSEGAIGYAQQALQTQGDAMKVKQATLETSPEYQQLIGLGYGPTVARIYLAAKAGEVAGVGAGAADAITNAIGGRFLGKIISEGGGVATRVGKGFANEGIVEGIQSPFEQLAQNAAMAQTVNPAQNMSEGVLESAIQGFLVGGITGAGFSGLLGRSLDEEQAKDGAQSVVDLFAAASQSLTGKRSPDTLGQFLDHVAPDATVLIDPGRLTEILSQTGVDLRVLPTAEAQVLAGEDAGAGIEIPISELITGLSGTEAEKAIIPHLRMGADLPTLAEVQEHQGKAAAFFQDEADRILAEESKNEAFQTAAQAVQDDLFAQLTAVGRQGPQVNTGYAKLGGAFYSVLASELGVTPLQVRDGWTDAAGVEHRGYALKIGGAPVRGPKLGQGFSHGLAMLNVGLDVGATDRAQKIDENFVKAELAKIGVQVTSGSVVKGQYELDGKQVEEQTYVPHLSRPLTEAEATKLSEVLGQEAIGHYSNGQGNLWGPNAAAWGDFNPEFFKDQAGDTLASVQSLGQVTPAQAMETNVPLALPTVPEFVEAVTNTAGAEVTKDGLLVNLVRFQKPEQEGAQSVRTGVFYLPVGSKAARYYKNKGTMASGNEYGGSEAHAGETLIRAPLFVKGATGGKAPAVAYDQLKGKGAYEKMRTDVLHATLGFGSNTQQKIENVREMLLRYGADAGLANEIVRNSTKGNLLPYAVQENIVAHAVREAGHDAVVGYSKGKEGLFISEVFDVREQTYPARGMDSQIHDSFNQSSQTVSQAQIEQYRKDVAWTSEGAENGLPVWSSAHVSLSEPRDVTESHDVFYMPLDGERAVKYAIKTPEGKVVGYTVLEIADGWPTKLLDIETNKAERGKRYAEYTVAAIANDVGELGIWHIVPEARSWWDRQGTAPVDEYHGTLTFDAYADARASRENPQGVGDEIVFHQSQSTRRPTTKRAPEDHLGGVPLVVDYTKIEPAKTAQNMALVSKYPGLRFKARDPAKRAEEFIQHVTSNLLWLHDQIPAAVRQRSKLWYDGARAITDRWSERYNKTDAQIAAVLAVYSPQKDWFMNVSLAERTLDIVRNNQNTPWSSEMSAVSSAILAKDQFALLRSSIEGKTLSQLTDKLEQAAWLRVYDEAHNNRGHRLVTPEGDFGKFVQNAKDVDAKTGWPGFATIIKALYVLEDSNPATIDAALGGEHKVRSFYNNIFHPASDLGFVTIDTHAVAAGLLRPLSGNSIEVSHNFGRDGAAASAATGMSGTYPYYQEAYRRAAEARGLLPREMQSIAWEAVRELYTMGFKHDKAKLTALDNLWTAYEKGKPIPRIEGGEATEDTSSAEGSSEAPDRASNLDAVRRNILALAGGIERPAWLKGNSGLSEQGWASTYTDELLGRSVPRTDRGTVGRRGSNAAESAPEVLNQSAPLIRAGAVSAPVVGAHFSKQARATLNSSAFGTGLSGAERERLAASNDPRIKQRIAFYIDEGSGVHPEAGVGGAAHVATLTNLYDADADTLKIFRRNQRDPNAAESAVLDAGFDGYLQRKNFTNQGTAVLLGSRAIDAEHVGGVEEANARTTVPPPAEVPAMKALAIQLTNDRTLPGGSLLPNEWRAALIKKDSPLVKQIDFEQFNPDERLYKDELARALWQTSETWYYSQLTRAIENASEKVFTTGKSAAQWLTANAGKLGVKKEELEFTGITDWLELQPKVTKADVVAFMREGGVKVEEVVLGAKTDQAKRLQEIQGEMATAEGDRWQELYIERARLANDHISNYLPTKFSDYQLPGGENYRELLITLPVKAKGAFATIDEDGYINERFDTQAEAEAAAKRDGISWDRAAPQEDNAIFRSSHFDQPNILAHIRMNERTDAEGARVLFVEEVQSDWGQKGKKEGFQQDAIARRDEFANNRFGRDYADLTAEEQGRIDRATEGVTGVPSAPFVTDTKGWTSLAVKRIVAYAAENGFEKVAWTTGAQQADRYDLSKQIRRVEYLPESKTLRAFDLNGDAVLDQTTEEADIEDYVGKEVAKNLLESEPTTTGAGKKIHSVEGNGLKVGGEGMKGFYDQILPQVVRDVLKKVGGGQVENVGLWTDGEVSDPFEVQSESGTVLATGTRAGMDSWVKINGGLSWAKGAHVVERSTPTQPGFSITPSMRESVAKGLPLFQPNQGNPKIGSFSPQTLDLRLLADANYSTFVHELGHFFLTAYADLAAQEGAPKKIVDDMSAILKQFGVADLATWNAMPLQQQRPYHEQLAESFEQYVFTGKAPSLELQPLFSTMLAWFKKVYQSLKSFVATHDGAKLNPELSAVFDRMLATDAAIAEANAARGYAALFKDAAEAGMSDKDFAAYTALGDAQREDAESMLRTRSLRDLKWMHARRNKIITALQEDAKEKRAEVRKDIAAEVKAEPIRQAERYLKHGVILNETGSDIAPLGPNKLQISEVKALFPEEALTPQPDFSKLGYGKYGLLAEVGLSPEEVAARFGMPSGIELIDQLFALPKLNDDIEARTDQAMLERYGDLSSPEAMSQAADEAIHNAFRARAVATELSALATNIGPASVLMKAAKEYARQVLETKTSKTLKPWSYAAAETRAGKAALAALRKGDRALAAAEKRTELVNHTTAKEAYVVEKEIKAIITRFKKLAAYNNESSAVKARDFATVQAVRALLADHGIGSKGEAAATYLETVKTHDPAAAARIQELIDVTSETPKHWSEISVSNLRNFSEAIDDIWFVAARARQMEVQGKMVAQEAIAKDLLETLVEQGIPARAPGEGWAPTPTEKLAMKFGAMKAQWARMEFIASKLDGNRPIGPWLKNVVSVVHDAQARMMLTKADVLGQYEALLKTIAPTLGRGEIAAPELGYIFGRGDSGSGKMELLHAILHTGNESNMRKLLLGREDKVNGGFWAAETQSGTLETGKWDRFIARMIREGRLTKADYDFAQGVWDLMDNLKPAAQRAHRVVFGKFFAEVTATPFENQFGKYAGGYVPALVDSDIVKDREIEKLRDAATDEMDVAFPAPPKGFTNARVESYARELKLDLRALGGHINQVLLFSHMAVPVSDIRRVLSRPEIAGAINRLYPGVIVSAINPWLVRVARNTVSPLSTDMTRFVRLARSRAGVNTMMGSVSNSVQQVTGIIPASVAIEGKYLRSALVDTLTHEESTADFVKSLSPYMRTRIDNEVFAAMDNVEQILVNPNVYQSMVDWTRRHAYFMQSAVDNALSPTLWLASFNQARDNGVSERDAVHVADSLIRKTQGASGSADIATFEAGHPFIQLFTQFSGYFNMMAQFLQGEFVKNLAREVGLPKKYARAFYIVGIGFYAQAVAAELISMLFRGGPADDDKDGALIDDWLFQLGIMAPFKFMTATVPFLGSAVLASANKWNDKPYDDKMLNSPAVSAIEGALGAPVDVYNALYKEGKPSKAIRSVGGVGGLFGLPTGLLARPAGYWADVAADRVAPTSFLDAIRGTITGTASPDSKQ